VSGDPAPATPESFGIARIEWDDVPFDSKIECCWYDSGGVRFGHAWRSPEGRHRKARGYQPEGNFYGSTWIIYHPRHMPTLAALLMQGKIA